MGLTAIITAATWAALVFAVIAGLAFVAMPLVLGRAQKAIRAHPPVGPDWAQRVWRDRRDVYGAIIASALTAAVLTFIFSLL